MMKSLQMKMRARRAGACEEGVVEEGFTLIELMVVLLIMGILMAIAIPTFLGVTGSAKDKGAQSDAVNADTVAKVYYENNQSYTGLTTGYLASASHSIAYDACTAKSSEAAGNAVDVCLGTGGNSVEFISYSPTGLCWVMVDSQNASGSSSFGTKSGTWYGYSTVSGSPSTATCAVAGPPAGITSPTSGWQNAWPPAPAGQ